MQQILVHLKLLVLKSQHCLIIEQRGMHVTPRRGDQQEGKGVGVRKNLRVH